MAIASPTRLTGTPIGMAPSLARARPTVGGRAGRAHAHAAQILERGDLLAGREDAVGRQDIESQHLDRRVILVEQPLFVERPHRLGPGDRVLVHQRQFHHRGLREAAGVVALHRRRDLDVALLDHVEEVRRLAVAADRLQSDFDAAGRFLLDGAGEGLEDLGIARRLDRVDRAKAQDVVGGRDRRQRRHQDGGQCGDRCAGGSPEIHIHSPMISTAVPPQSRRVMTNRGEFHSRVARQPRNSVSFLKYRLRCRKNSHPAERQVLSNS